MPYTLKTNQISVKDPETGEYSGVDILAEQTEQGLIAELQAEGTTQVNRINQAAVDVQAAVDQAESDAATIISNTQTSINTLEAQKNTIAQTVASMAELGTDTTLSTPGMAADAGAVGDLNRQISDLESATSELNRAVFGGYHDTSAWSRGAFEANGYSALTSLRYVHSEKMAAGSYVITPASGFYCEVYTYVSDTVGTIVYGFSGNTLSFTANAPFIVTSRKNPSADISAQELENYNEYIDIYHVLSQTSISEDVADLKASSTGAIKDEILMDGLLFFYKQQRPTITKSGTDFIVTIPENPRGFYTKSGQFYPLTGAGTTGTITVPTSSYLVYNITDNVFEVMTYQQINASTDDLILAFGNNNGYLYGQWERFLLEDEITNAIAECNNYTDVVIGENALPSYYDTYMPNKLATIRTHIADAGAKGVSFAFISDIHYDSAKQNNMRNSTLLMREISQKTSVKTMICGGDLITIANGSKDAGISLEQEVITDFRTQSQMNTFWAVGNHEYNNPGNDQSLLSQQLSLQEIYPTLTQGNDLFITLSDSSGAYYFDDPKNKVRFLFSSCTFDSLVDEAAITWLIETLPDTPTDFDIVLISHLGIYYNPTSGAYTGPVDAFKPLLQALQAYKGHSTFSYGGASYDFTQKSGTVLGAFLGHYHVDGSGTWYGIPCVIITTDSLNKRSGTLPTRTAGTITEQAFDVVTIDRTAKTIFCTRIGAGEDRTITYT